MEKQNAYVEFLCNQPRKLGTRFDEDCLGGLEDNNIHVDYQTKCCHQDGQRHQFTLTFSRDDVDDCENVNLDRVRCKNFWEFVDQEPVLSGLIKEGRFMYSNKPSPCSTTKLGPADAELNSPEILKVYERVKEIRARDRQLLAERREKVKQLQLRSGQKVQVFKRCPASKPPEDTFSCMIKEDMEEEFASLKEYDNQVKMKMLLKDPNNPFRRLADDEDEDDCELAEEPNDSQYLLSLAKDTIARQSFVKETLDSKQSLDKQQVMEEMKKELQPLPSTCG